MSFWCHRLVQNSNENIIRISALKAFIASLGLPVGFLINDITYPGSPQEATKKFRAKILTIFLLIFWSKRWHQKDISKLTDLYMFRICLKIRIVILKRYLPSSYQISKLGSHISKLTDLCWLLIFKTLFLSFLVLFMVPEYI